MRYDAFISYRHSELDMEIAKKLHRGLETFTIPASVGKKYGKKKIERVFRDQEELPIGSDLDDNITAALAESEFLIVICSPRTPKSVWVLKEIETFIKLHDRDHVLAILIEGEPDESFPSLLLTDENGKSVEPLAADIRGETEKERNKKFKTELMRLVAPLVGCEYDDLKQRHRERIIRRNLFIASMVLILITGLGIAFGLYNAVVAKNMEELANRNADLAMEKSVMAGQIFVQLQETQKNQSRFYAEKSLSLLSEGRREAAVLTAMEGLPDGSEDERPYVPEVEYALSTALHVYDDGSILDHDKLLHHEQIVDTMKSCADGKYLVSKDRNENVYVWETETWNQKIMIPRRVNENYYLEEIVDAYADDNAVYICTRDSFTAYDYNGQEIYCDDKDFGYVDFEYCKDKNIAILISSEEVECIDLASGKTTMTIGNTLQGSFTSKGSYVGEGIYAVSHYSEKDVRTCMTMVNTETGESVDTELRYDHILKTAGSVKGYVAVVTCNPDFYMGAGVTDIGLDLIDREGNVLWSRDLDIHIVNAATFSTEMKIQDYNDKLVLVIEQKAYFYDVADGTKTADIALYAYISSMMLSTNTDYGLIGYGDGNIEMIDSKKGTIVEYSRTETGLSLTDMLSFEGQRVIKTRNSPDLYLMTYHKGKDIEELPDLDEGQIAEAIAPDGSYYVMSSSVDGKILTFYDSDGNAMYVFDKSDHYPIDIFCMEDKAMIATIDGIWEADPKKGSATLTDFRKMGSDDTYTKGLFSEDGKYGIFWSGHWLGVFDLENKSLIYGEEQEDMIGCAGVTADGSTVYISINGKNLTEIDISSGKKREFFDGSLRETANSNLLYFLAVSPSGKMVAMFCADGKARLIDTEDEKQIAAIPIQIKSFGTILFDTKEEHLLMQSEDHTIYIWDIKKNEYSCIIESHSELRYITTDEKDDKVICCDSMGIHLLDESTFVRIAYIPDGVSYIPSERAFIQKDNRRVFKSHYMNYMELIEEAKRQFPDSKLGPREKKEYNIE